MSSTNYEILFGGNPFPFIFGLLFLFSGILASQHNHFRLALICVFLSLVASMSSGFLPCSSLCGIFIIGTSVSCNVAYLAF